MPVVVLPFTYARMIEEVEAGQKVLINDGRDLGCWRWIEMSRGRAAACRVMTGGLVTSGKGINLAA